jgi:hypothetical protein
MQETCNMYEEFQSENLKERKKERKHLGDLGINYRMFKVKKTKLFLEGNAAKNDKHIVTFCIHLLHPYLESTL